MLRARINLSLITTLLPLIGFLAAPAGAVLPESNTSPPGSTEQSIPMASYKTGPGLPEGWVAAWRDGKPVRALGSSSSRRGLRFSAGTAAHALDRFFVNQGWAADGELELVVSRQDGQGTWLQYKQTHRGIRVVDGRAYARLSKSGRLAMFGVDTIPGRLLGDPVPSVTLERALASAISGNPSPDDLDLRRHELVLVSSSKGGVNALNLAYELEFVSTRTHEAWLAYVDAKSGELIRRESLVRHTSLSGTALADIEPLQPGDPYSRELLNYVEVSLLRADSTVAAADTTRSGLFSLVHEEGTRVRAGLSGPYGVVMNNTFGNETPVLTWEVGDSTGSFEALFTDGNTRVQDRDAYYWGMVSRDYIRNVEPTFDFLDYPMPIVTDLAGQQCNAFWNGEGMTFYPAGGPCANTARLSSVVIHEYGHGITDWQYRPFRPSGAMHEGFSDYFSATLLNDPVIGRGFTGPGTSLRTIDNNLRQPNDLVGESHHDGLIIGGALWDLREELGQARTDSLWHYARYGFSKTFDDYFVDVLITDDDDGDIYNGTPNFDAIVDAFKGHGIGDYSIAVAHMPEPDSEDTAKSFALTASFVSIFQIVPDSVQVHLTIENGGGSPSVSSSHTMTPTGEVREYRYDLPAQPADSKVSYRFSAVDIQGMHVSYPADGSSFEFRVGQDTTPPVIAHVPPYRVAADSEILRVQAHISDNLDQPLNYSRLYFAVDEGSMDSTAVDSLGLAELPGGYAAGQEITYWFEVQDGALVPNTSRNPVQGTHSLQVSQGLSRSFESNGGGLIAEGDWEWGLSPFLNGVLGDHLWATNLDGTYSSNSTAQLRIPTLDLSGWTRASLVFDHFYDFENFWDGCRVMASVDGGVTYELLYPVGGYPSPLLSDSLPGYTGFVEEWQRAEFDLTHLIGEPDVRVIFQVLSDVGLEGFGWYIDNVELVERQLTASPQNLTAWSGQDSKVTLSWTPPVVDVDHPQSTFLGYKLYEGEGSSRTLLTPEPVNERRYIHLGLNNGRSYTYFIEAEYEDGPSPLVASGQATPFVAATSVETETIFAEAQLQGSDTVSLAVENTGSGLLHISAFEGITLHTPDHVRIRYSFESVQDTAGMVVDPAGKAVLEAASYPKRNGLDRQWTQQLSRRVQQIGGKARVPLSPVQPAQLSPPPGEYTVLYTDQMDAQIGPGDLRNIEIQHDSFNVWIKLTSYRGWADPTGFTLAVGFDTDVDLDTGSDSGDYVLMAGEAALNLFGYPAVLVDQGFRLVGLPHYSKFNIGEKAAEFGFDMGLIGLPREMYMAAGILPDLNENLSDEAPSIRPLTWFDPQSTLDVPAGESRDLVLKFNSGFLPKSIYTGNLFLDTNDPTQPSITIPLHFNVGGVPVLLSSFRGRSVDRGVLLTWRTGEELDHLGFEVFRGSSKQEPVRVSSGLVEGRNGSYEFLDSGATLDLRYEYYLESVSRIGDRQRFGPLEVRFSPDYAARLVLRPSAPNPIRQSGKIRFGLPERSRVRLQLFDVQGQRIRTLVDGRTLAEGFHEIPWDGRDDQGRAVASGIYHVLLRSASDQQKGRIVLIR